MRLCRCLEGRQQAQQPAAGRFAGNREQRHLRDAESRSGTRAAVLQYIADRVPASRLAPPAGSLERYRLVSLLNFIATELHKAFAPLFHPHTPEDFKALVRRDQRALRHVESTFGDGRPWLMGEDFTVGDAYLFSVLRLGPQIGVVLDAFPLTRAFIARAAAQPAVRQALAAEGAKDVET